MFCVDGKIFLILSLMMEKNEKREIQFYKVSSQKRKTYDKLLANVYFYDTNYKDIVNMLFAMNNGSSIGLTDDSGEVEEWVDNPNDMPTRLNFKNAFKRLLSTILADQRNLKIFVSLIDYKMKEVWRQILLNLYVSESQAEMITGSKISVHRDSWMTVCCKQYSMFNLHRYYLDLGTTTKYISYLDLDIRLGKLFFPCFFPEKMEPVTVVNTLPQELQLKTARFEQMTIADVMRLKVLWDTGKMKASKTKMLSLIVQRKAKALNMDEFYSKTECDKAASIRTDMLAGMMSYFAYNHADLFKDSILPHVLIKHIFEKGFDKRTEFVTFFLLPYIEFHVSTLEVSKLLNKMLKNITDLLIQHPDGWMAVDRMLDTFYTINYLNNSILEMSCFMPIDRGQIFNTLNRVRPSIFNQVQEIAFPLVRSLLFVLASFGVIDMAYEALSDKLNSLYEGARYVRLTPLGRYVLGIAKEYTPVGEEEKKYGFVLEDGCLVVRSAEPDNPFESLLQIYGRPINGSRYEVTAQTFIANCTTKKQLQEKVKAFTLQVAGGKLPRIWQEFFNKLIDRCQPFTEENSSDYRIYSFSGQNRNLMQLIVNDPILKKIVIRAENYTILVKKENLLDFKYRMTQQGYII